MLFIEVIIQKMAINSYIYIYYLFFNNYKTGKYKYFKIYFT